MEEEKAAAYYEELTRNGRSASRFKHGLGFSSSSSHLTPPRNDAAFVKATSPSSSCHPTNSHHLLSVRNKLTLTKHTDKHRDRDRDRDRGHKRRSSSRDRRRSVSRSPEKYTKKKRRGDVIQRRGKSAGVDYANLIHGYAKMSPAERVKAKMKFQLSETAEKDAMNGMGSGWERFEFDKDAPLDDEEMEVADDDIALVKHIGQSFRFSAVEANRDDKIKAAHDEAMFGSSSVLPSIHTESIIEQENESKSKEIAPATSLLSDKVIAGQQGSWRDRARKA